MNIEGLVRDEQDRHVLLGCRAVLHLIPFGKPEEVARTVAAFVRLQRSFEHVHAVGAVMGMQRVDEPFRVANDPYLHSGVGIDEEFFAMQRHPGRLVEPIFPGL